MPDAPMHDLGTATLAIAAAIRRHLTAGVLHLEIPPDRYEPLVVSFVWFPLREFKAGSPYVIHHIETRALADCPMDRLGELGEKAAESMRAEFQRISGTPPPLRPALLSPPLLPK